MAETNVNTEAMVPENPETGAVNETTAKTEDTAAKDNSPSVQDLMLEVAKLRRSVDKASAEAAEYKRKYKDTLSEKEQASMEKAERDAAFEEQYKALVRENALNKYSKQFIRLGYTEEQADKAAAAQYDGDTDTLFQIQSDVQQAKIKDAEKVWLASRPQAQTGTGSATVTKEQFDKMSLIQKSKLYEEDPETYKRLLGR